MKTHTQSTFTHLKQLSPVVISQPGEYIFFFHNISGELDVSITCADAKVYLFGLYTGKANDTYTLRTVQHHCAQGSWSELLVKGVFDDRSKLSYSGLIRIEKNCNGSHAYQKNQNILLSRQAHVSSEPNLEILSPDVFCTHGSTTGSINKEMIHYMMTRGLTRDESRRLYIDGFIEDLLKCVRERHHSFEMPL